MKPPIFARYQNAAIQYVQNPGASAAAHYPKHLHAALSPDDGERAIRTIRNWHGYTPTPLCQLKDLAAHIGVAHIYYKDESGRFATGSFKALGGAYAVSQLVANHTAQNGSAADDITVVAATDGNHGRSVAWGANRFGCRCRIYIHAGVSRQRQCAIESFGAQVIRIDGNYDDSVHLAAAEAQKNGWFVVADTAYPGCEDAPRQVMAGYCLMMEEILQQLSAPLTHIFVQGGVGGLAAVACAWLWHKLGEQRPKMTVVEPILAACLYQSARRQQATAVSISQETMMAGLSCGEVSTLAWDILQPGAHGFMTIEDELIPPLMRALAAADIEAGESGVAGLAGVLAAATQSSTRAATAITADSNILVLGTEGATDAEIYANIIGASD